MTVSADAQASGVHDDQGPALDMAVLSRRLPSIHATMTRLKSRQLRTMFSVLRQFRFSHGSAATINYYLVQRTALQVLISYDLHSAETLEKHFRQDDVSGPLNR